MNIPAKDVFGCDYTNLEAVIALCKRCGPGNVVVRGEKNFVITKECRINGREVMFRF